EAEIKKAFRSLAKKYHPDKHGGDEAAVKKFKEISGAYDILGDKDKRGKFDRGEIDEQGNPRGFDPRQGGGGFEGNPFGFGAVAGGRARAGSNTPTPAADRAAQKDFAPRIFSPICSEGAG